MKDYEDTVRQADALVASGNAFEAVRLYERAARVTYNNKLATDTAALNAKLTAARSARDARKAASTSAPPRSAAGANQYAGAPTTSISSNGTTSAEDAIAWIQYGDGLVAVSKYGDAVRAWPRPRFLR